MLGKRFPSCLNALSSLLWRRLKTLTSVICVAALALAPPLRTSGWTDFNLMVRTVWKIVRAGRNIHRRAPPQRWKRPSLNCAVSTRPGVAESWKYDCFELGHTGVPSPSTITAILRRHQLLDPKESAKHQAFLRFERAAPNELWQMDFKVNSNLPRVVVIR